MANLNKDQTLDYLGIRYLELGFEAWSFEMKYTNHQVLNFCTTINNVEKHQKGQKNICLRTHVFPPNKSNTN